MMMMTMMMLRNCRKSARRRRTEMHKANCRWRAPGNRSEPACRIWAGATVSAMGLCEGLWVPQKEEGILPHPLSFQFTWVNYTPTITPWRDLGSPHFQQPFFLSILLQVCSFSHLSMCHFPSTLPLMHLLKNNFQSLLVTRRDAETERRES